nr:F-box protein PP2-B10-like [Ipomoea batatas]
MAVATGGDIGFEVLPEDCIANALSLTSPEDACRLSLVASAFYSAAQFDAVWERFLPADYRDIISRSGDAADLLASASKKDLYFRLCDNPILIDDGTKSFSLEKKSGKKCYMLAARSLKIVWSDTPRYWQWISLPESRFSEAAELLDVCWLEICGKINSSMLSPNTNYAAYLVFSLQPRAYGFEYQPVEASIEISGHEAQKKTVYLDHQRPQKEGYTIIPRRIGIFNQRVIHRMRQREKAGYSKERSDKWMEVELGEFFVKNGQDAEIAMCLMQIKSHWKSGVIVQGIEVRPKGEDK